MRNENGDPKVDIKSFLSELREFALVVGEECPEGHRKDPASGRCLPISGQDHTAYTRSVNVDDGPKWRGEAHLEKEQAVDAELMEDLQSCAAGTTFSFIQRKCVPLEEAEAEISDPFALAEDGTPITESVTSSPPLPCSETQFLDENSKICVDITVDRVLSMETVEPEFKALVASLTISGRLGVTSQDPVDGHYHLVTGDETGNGQTSLDRGYSGLDGGTSHSHKVSEYVVEDWSAGEYTSRHFGYVIPKNLWEYEEKEHHDSYAQVSPAETAAPITSEKRKSLPDSAFGVPGKRKFPLDTCARVRNAMARFNQAKDITSSEKSTLRRKILARAKACGIEVTNFAKATTDLDFAKVTSVLLEQISREDSAARMERYKASSELNVCPPGFIWNAGSRRCSRDKDFARKLSEFHEGMKGVSKKHMTEKKEVEECPPGEVMNPFTKKCYPKKTSGGEELTVSRAIHLLDEIIKDGVPREKNRVEAKAISNAAFPPSLINNTKRALLHHTPEASDPYDHASLDITRLRNALFRASSVSDFSAKAVEDALEHLMFHAKAVIDSWVAEKKELAGGEMLDK